MEVFQPSRRSRAASRVVVALALVALGVASPSAPAAEPASHYAFRVAGLAATPLWWSTGIQPLANEVTRYDAEIPAGVVVRVFARASAGAGVHLYAFPTGNDGALPYALQDALPGGVKSLVLAGPARATVLVDASPSGPYEIVATFDGRVGDPELGAPAPFALIARGSYACTYAPVGACPP